jgi:CheY-like chemotaxis protein
VNHDAKLKLALALIDGAEVVGRACHGAEAVRLAEAHRPDVVLMDLRMPGTGGIAATADLRQRMPATRVLVLTTYADEAAIVPALRAGAPGLPDQGRQRRADRGRDPRDPRRAGLTWADSPAITFPASPRDGRWWWSAGAGCYRRAACG